VTVFIIVFRFRFKLNERTQNYIMATKNSPLYVFQDSNSNNNKSNSNSENQQQQPQRSHRSSTARRPESSSAGRTPDKKTKTTKRRSTGTGTGTGTGNGEVKKDKKPITKSIKKSIRNQIQKIKSSSSSNKGGGGGGGGGGNSISSTSGVAFTAHDGILVHPPRVSSSSSSTAVVAALSSVKKRTTKSKVIKDNSKEDAAAILTTSSPSKKKNSSSSGNIKKKSSAVAVVPSPRSSSARKVKDADIVITKQQQQQQQQLYDNQKKLKQQMQLKQQQPQKKKKTVKKNPGKNTNGTTTTTTTTTSVVKLKRSRGKEKSHHRIKSFSNSSYDDYSSFDNHDNGKGSSFFSGDSLVSRSGSSSGSSSNSDSDSSSYYDGLESFISSEFDSEDSGSGSDSSESSSYSSSDDDERTKTERAACNRNPSVAGGDGGAGASIRRGRSRNPRPHRSPPTTAVQAASVAAISSPRRNQQKPKSQQQQQPSFDDSNSDTVTNSDDSSYISGGFTSYDDNSSDGSISQSEYYITSYDDDDNHNDNDRHNRYHNHAAGASTTFDDTDRENEIPLSTFGSEETERTNLTSSNYINKRRCGGLSSDGGIISAPSRDSTCITVINDIPISNDHNDYYDDDNAVIGGGEEETIIDGNDDDETNRSLPAASFSTFGSTEEDQEEFEDFVKEQNEIEKVERYRIRQLAEIKRQEELLELSKIQKQQEQQKAKEIADADDNNSNLSGWGSWIFSGFGGGGGGGGSSYTDPTKPPTAAVPAAGAEDNDVVGILGSYKKGSDNNNETTQINEKTAPTSTIRSPRKNGTNVKDFNDGDNDDDENSITVRDDRRTFSAFHNNNKKNKNGTAYISFDDEMLNRQQQQHHQQQQEEGLENDVAAASGCGFHINHILDGGESIAESYGGLRNGEFLLSNHSDSFSQQDQQEQQQQQTDVYDNNNDHVEQLSVTMRGSATFDDDEDDGNNDNGNSNAPQEISFSPRKEENNTNSKRLTETTKADDNGNEEEDDTSSLLYCCFAPNQDRFTHLRTEKLLTGARTKPEGGRGKVGGGGGGVDGIDALFSSSVTLGQEFERRTSKYGGIDKDNGNSNNNIDAVSTLGGDDYYEEDDATCASTINTDAYSQDLFKDMKTNTDYHQSLHKPSSRLELQKVASTAAENVVTNGVVEGGLTAGGEEIDHFVMIPVDTEDYKDDNEDDSFCSEDNEIELGSCGGGNDINDKNGVDVSDKAVSDNNNRNPTRRRIQAECLENYDISEIVHGRRAFKSKKNEDGSPISTPPPSTNPGGRRARRQNALKAHRDFLYGSYSKDTFVDDPVDNDIPMAEKNKDTISSTKGGDGSESYVAEVESKVTAVPDGSVEQQQQHDTTSTIPAFNDKGVTSSDLTAQTNSILQDDATLPSDDSKPDALMELVRNAFTVMMSPDGNTAASAASATPPHNTVPKTEYVNDNDSDAASTNCVQGEESTTNIATSNSAENVWGVAYNFFGTKNDETPIISESQNDHTNEEDGALKCNDYNPNPVLRPTAIHSDASNPISTTSGDVLQPPSAIPSKISNLSAPSVNITEESLTDTTILSKDLSPKATRVSRSNTKNNNTRFNSDGIPLQLSPKKIWRAFDSRFDANPPSTADTEATNLPISDFLSSPGIVEENKTIKDNNAKQKDQEDTSSTPTNEVRSPKMKVPTEKKQVEDEPARRKFSSRYRKHSDLLRLKNRRLHKNTKSPEIQRHSKEQFEKSSPQEKEPPTTKRHDATKSPSTKQRSQNRSPTKQDDECYSKNKDETNEIAKPTATDIVASSPSKTKPSSSSSPSLPQKHKIADIRSRIKQRRRTKMFLNPNHCHRPKEEKKNANATKSSSSSTSSLKVRSSTSKITTKSVAVTNNIQTRKTKSRVESRNDSDASKDHDNDEFYDAITFDDDDNHNDGADDERRGKDVTTTEQYRMSSSSVSKETNPNSVFLSTSSITKQHLVIPEDQERDFASISYKESILSGVMSLD
jgi:hypothetical protein